MVRREFIHIEPGRRLSALIWGAGEPELVLLHGGSQNAHTWDTVAMALDRCLAAIDLPGHGHSDRPRSGRHLDPLGNAEDVAVAIRAFAPKARCVVGMSLGGLTTIALTQVAPELVRAVVLVDVTPGVNPTRAKQIVDFISGPTSFTTFEELLQWTIQSNPSRTETSLRRGVLHNAVQLEDGSWIWRWARWRGASEALAVERDGSPEAPSDARMFSSLWDLIDRITVPVMLARGMRPEAVVDDENEQELRRRLPDATVIRFDNAGHSIQGDMPVELAEEIERFVF